MSLQVSSGDASPEGQLSNRQILAGIETEYGFTVEGRGAEDQIEDAIAFLKAYPDPCFVGWDYRYESPRADLRGFSLERLAFDPEDAKRDAGKDYGAPHDVRSDRILPNGARFYNDHGHPEYATPECFSLAELVLHDKAGEFVLGRAARALAAELNREVRVYKNNTDFHGSSYGTHESYLVPRGLGFDQLFPAVLPMLVARQILTGAGKVGSEIGRAATYQVSCRADFFVEPANAETLFRRPIFNTRDEPHAPPADWIRLHVISGDANMIPGCTRRKVAFVKLAILLCQNGTAPQWELANPVDAFQAISRDESAQFKVTLKSGSWTTAYEILESYFSAAEQTLEFDVEMAAVIEESRNLMTDLAGTQRLAAAQIDWVAKRNVLQAYMADAGTDWRDPDLKAYDLEYHNIDPEDGLYFALEAMGDAEPYPPLEYRLDRLTDVPEHSRAWARGLAVQKFQDHLVGGCWRSLTFRIGDRTEEVQLRPDIRYPLHLGDVSDVESYIQILRSL